MDATHSIPADIQAALQRCPNLPSPPRIAILIVEMARDPEVELAALSKLLARDPALASRVLRAANSAFYARRRRSDNLRQALIVIGLNATMTLALSFSLSEALSDSRSGQAAVGLVWRRALIAATASRLIGERAGVHEGEDLFLAGLLQDLGVLALDAAIPGRYRPVLEKAEDHDSLLALERAHLQTDHGAAGTWLMRHWQLPERMAWIATAAHAPEAILESQERRFAECVAVGGLVADHFLSSGQSPRVAHLAAEAQRLLAISEAETGRLLKEVGAVLPEVSELYDTEIINPRVAAGVIDEAREILAARNLQLIHQVIEQQNAVREMESATHELREIATRDPLTGLHNRRHFDDLLAVEFGLASENGWPLTVGFVDLDKLKEINDTYGHQVGDGVLHKVAACLSRHLRERDLVMRYGGDEFVVLLPGTGSTHAAPLFDRLRKAVEAEQHDDGRGGRFSVTVSLGMASHMDGGWSASSAEELLRAADAAMYGAKRSGRNQVGRREARD